MNYQALKAELTAGHPVTGAYNATDATAAAELNALNIAAAQTPAQMLLYLLNKKHRTNQGSDDTFSPIIGRLAHVARSEGGGDPFGRASGGYGGLDVQHIHACATFLELLRSPLLADVDFSDSNLPYGFVEASGAWSTSHSSDLQALSTNKTSRAAQIAETIDFYGTLNETHVSVARAS